MSVVEYILISRQRETEKENEAALSKDHHVEFWQDCTAFEARHNVQVQKQLAKDGYDPDDKGQRGDQSLSGAPLG